MPLDDVTLAALRHLGDPAADAVIAELPESLRQPAALHRALPVRRSEGTGHLPPAVQAFLVAPEPLQPDLDDLAQAERLFFEWGDACLALAATWAVPLFLATAGRSGALLGLPGERRATSARGLELLQLVVDVLALDGLAGRSPEARGARSLQRARLGWALDRALLEEAGWDSATLGRPLGQTDLALLVLALQRLPAEALPEVGITPREADAAGWRRSWTVLGRRLGVDGRLLPTDPHEAEALWRRLAGQVAHEGSEAPQVVTATIEGLERILPGTVLDGFTAAMAATLLGEEQAGILGLPAVDWQGEVDRTYALMHGGVLGATAPGHRERIVVERYGKALVEGLGMTLRPLAGRPFHVPRTLRRNWNTQAVLRTLSELDTARSGTLGTGLAEPAPDSPWSDQRLDAAREEGDPEADFLLQRLAPSPSAEETAEDVALRRRLNAMLRFMVQHPHEDGELPAELLRFRDEIRTLPAWTDFDELAVAGELFRDHGAKCIAVLLTYGLPVGYGALKGSKVLTATKRLSYPTSLRRRICETAQMVVDVVQPGAFEPGGQGLVTCMHVRLMHAMIRQSLLNHPDEAWNTEFLGVPICQEDLLATSLCFSYCTLTGLERLGVDYGEDAADRQRKREAWIHLWRVVGALMGCDEALLPRSYDEARTAWAAIYRRQVQPSVTEGNPDGLELTQALLGFLDELLPVGVEELPPALMRELLGDPLAEALGVPDTAVGRGLLHITRLFWDATDETGAALDLLGRALDRFSVMLVERLLAAEGLRGAGRPPFQIPLHSRVRWAEPGQLPPPRSRLRFG